MSDTDQGWKPSGRPQSTMAQAFSSMLDTTFSLDSDVDQLSQNIDSKKHEMMMQSRELEILQAKIREADNRLKAQDSTPAEGGSSRNDGGKGEGQGSTDSNYPMGSQPRRSGNREYAVDDRGHRQQMGNSS